MLCKHSSKVAAPAWWCYVLSFPLCSLIFPGSGPKDYFLRGVLFLFSNQGFYSCSRHVFRLCTHHLPSTCCGRSGHLSLAAGCLKAWRAALRGCKSQGHLCTLTAAELMASTSPTRRPYGPCSLSGVSTAQATWATK